jgi:curved DNA-binding protein CbpA
MSDPFLLLGIARRPLLDPEAVGSAYRKLAGQLHPDLASGDTLKFRELSEAAEMLKDPARRLRELSGGSASSSGGSLPPEAADLFPKVASVLQQADSLLEKQGAATNALAKALLLTPLKKAAEDLESILSLLESWKSTLNQELHRLDQEWAAEEPPSPSTATALGLLSDSFTYAGRWELQLRNRKLALEATLG